MAMNTYAADEDTLALKAVSFMPIYSVSNFLLLQLALTKEVRANLRDLAEEWHRIQASVPLFSQALADNQVCNRIYFIILRDKIPAACTGV